MSEQLRILSGRSRLNMIILQEVGSWGVINFSID